VSFAKIRLDLVQLNEAKFDIFSAEFGDKVLCVSVSTPAAVLPARVTASHVCQTALAVGYNAVHSGDVTVHSGQSECTVTSPECTVASGQRSVIDMAGGHYGW